MGVYLSSARIVCANMGKKIEEGVTHKVENTQIKICFPMHSIITPRQQTCIYTRAVHCCQCTAAHSEQQQLRASYQLYYFTGWLNCLCQSLSWETKMPCCCCNLQGLKCMIKYIMQDNLVSIFGKSSVGALKRPKTFQPFEIY